MILLPHTSRASTHYRPDLSPTERAHRLTEMLTKVAAMVQNVIHVSAGKTCVYEEHPPVHTVSHMFIDSGSFSTYEKLSFPFSDIQHIVDIER